MSELVAIMSLEETSRYANRDMCRKNHTIFSFIRKKRKETNEGYEYFFVLSFLKMRGNTHRRIVSLSNLDHFWNKKKQSLR